MKHRIFIAINLPENIREKLADFRLKWPDLPVRWTKPENLHITLLFLGYLTDEELVMVCQTVKEIISKYEPFFITLNRVCYGPKSINEKPPRMVWVEGEKNENLRKIQESLENSLSQLTINRKENRQFSPHITLGRIRQWEFRRIELDERPQINEEIYLKFKVNSIEVMESLLEWRGPEYIIVESYKFQEL